MKKIINLLIIALSIFVAAFALTSCGSKDSKATIDSISVKENPTKLVYNFSEGFSSNGLVIEASKSDGSKEVLSSDKYTIDTSNFVNSSIGTYEIIVKLNSDESKTCSFNVSVVDRVGFSVKPGYFNKLIEYESANFEKLGIVIIEEYSDGSTKELSNENLKEQGYYYFSDPFVEEAQTGVELEIVATYDNSIKETITVDVLCEEDLTVTEFTATTSPKFTSLALENASDVDSSFYYMEFTVKYEEFPNRIFEYNYDSNLVDVDYSEVYQATEVGTYNAYLIFGDKKLTYEINLVDLNVYTFSHYAVDPYQELLTKYYLKECIDSSWFKYLGFVEVYTKDGYEDIYLPYYPGEITLDDGFENFTNTVGKKTITYYEDGEFFCTLEVEVLDNPLLDGIYVDKEDYTEEFKKEGDNYFVYSSSKGFKPGYSFVYAERYGDYITLYLENDTGDGYDVWLDSDGNLDEVIRVGEGSYRVICNFAGEENSTYAINGKLSERIKVYLNMYGIVHIGSKDGPVIADLSAYTFTEETTLYVVFQQDATGQAFLGNYIGTDPESPYYAVVRNDGVSIYSTKGDFLNGEKPMAEYEYRFEISDNIVNVFLWGGDEVVIDLETGNMDYDDGQILFAREN